MSNKKLTDLQAYEILKEESLQDLQSKGTLLRHKKSGAKIALIENTDENKVFYIAFRTPVDDSTGVPHIIEHTVLCGSDAFPVKDPFVELAKGSLNTFLNAMTYADKTIYPVASCNEKDFQNLMHVYLDAVFHPNIYKYEEIFKQEGWHYELESADAELTLNGVVYNEMKGAFSSPEGVLDRMILNSLFPDTTYANESGGDPEVIPSLTYEQYLDFHRRYYHPGNSYIYLYGDMDMAEKLEWMDEQYLSRYDLQPVDSKITLQKPFEKPIEVIRDYPVASSESLEDHTYLSYNLVADTILSKEHYLAFDVLDYALLSAPGAPLKQALLDAGIGKDIISSYDNSVLQPIFSIIAKNANLSDKEKFVAVIQDELRKLIQNGMDEKALLAGINSAEFKYREADFGSYPKGLIYGLQCMDSWLYDDMEPFMHLEAGETFAYLREQLLEHTGYFEKLAQKWLLDNPHASLVIIEPKRGLTAKQDQILAQKLADYKATLSESEIQQLIAETKHLKDYQATPSPKEDLEKIPLLQRGDMKKEPLPLTNQELTLAGLPVVWHDLATNGIDYVSLMFRLDQVSEEELPLLGVLKAVLGYVDTQNYSYSELANEINLYTGGISSTLSFFTDQKETDKNQAYFEVRFKVLEQNLPKAMELVCEILTKTKITDEKRLSEILAQVKSRLEMSMTTAGHSVSAIRAMSYFSPAGRFNDATGGIELYRTIADFEEHFDEKKEQLMAVLADLIDRIFATDGLLVSVTAGASRQAAVEAELQKLTAVLPDAGSEKKICTLHYEQKNEGFKDAAQIQYVSRAGNFRRHGFDYTGALRVLRVIMNYEYLWLNIRVQGGAYGCMSGFGKTGDTYFSSYRDPNLTKTNEIFEGIPEYVKNFDADERDMTKFIIGAVSEMDTPLTPANRGSRSMTAYLTNVSYEDLCRERTQVLEVQPEDIRALKDLLESVLHEQNICVIGNEDLLTKEKALFKHLEDLF